MKTPYHVILAPEMGVDQAALKELLTHRCPQGIFEFAPTLSALEGLVSSAQVDLAVIGQRLWDFQGLGLFDWLAGLQPKLPVIIWTASPEVKDAVGAIRRGAIDYLPEDGVLLAERLDRFFKLEEEGLTGSPGFLNALDQLSEMANLLQACLTPGEAHTVIVQAIEKMFPGTYGMLLGYHASDESLEILDHWGPLTPEGQAFLGADCWALRRGKKQITPSPLPGRACKRAYPDSPGCVLCLPLVSNHEAAGVLTFHLADASAFFSNSQISLAQVAAEQIGLSLTNLSLRTQLRDQVVRDDLSGLFNRSYMRETLERELNRAERNGQPVSLIVMDVDFFHDLNEQLGITSGDHFLSELGKLLKNISRSSDIACRSGGDEFMLILPDAPLEVARQRADQIRRLVKTASFQREMLASSYVTISVGVACWPLHGNTADSLIRAAERALTEAKQNHDSVVIAK